ncbi:MAG: pyridoxamine 5'-phosphate oxidase [Acidimicrobiia bacterium]|nr:pyridoxamine 5'-phosphate oxidase [Acidimicrobiia bacterium]
MTDLDRVAELAASETGLCVVSTSRTDGSSHATVVNAGVLLHPDTGGEVVGFVARGSSRKLEHIERTGRCALTFRRGWAWAGVEGPAEVIRPAPPPDEVDLPRLLRDVFTAAGGTHDDWDEYDRVMVAELRAAVLITPQRIIGR